MFRIKSLFTGILCLFLIIPCFGTPNSSPEDSDLIIKTKIYRDSTGQKKITDLTDKDFQEVKLPYFPGAKDGNLWFEFEVKKPDDIAIQLHNIYIDSDINSHLLSFVFNNGAWEKIENNTSTSFITTAPIIPILKTLYKDNDSILVRACTNVTKGSPIEIKIISNRDLLINITRSMSKFFISAGIGLCFCFGLLLVGLLLKDTAYLLLSVSSLLYILLAMQTKNMIPIIFWNKASDSFINPKFNYFIGCLEVLFLSISGHCFYLMNRKEKSIPKPLIVVIELSIIEALLIMTINSPVKLFITCTIISMIQYGMLIHGAILRVKQDETENKIIFLGWSISFSFFVIYRILFLLRNFACLQISNLIEMNENISSTVCFLFLFVPSLYSVGKRFNIRYQYVQQEYQNLEMKFIEQDKKTKIINSIAEPISRLADSVLNSACILSKLNFSAVNAEYIEFIKRESSKINDLLTAVRITNKAEELKETPILLLNFFNSCMLTTRRVASEKGCSASLTTAIANDTIVTGDPRLLQLLFIIPLTTTIALTKSNTKISIYIDEEQDSFTMTITNKFESEELDTPQKIFSAMLEIPIYEFINQIGRIYNTAVEIHPGKENCRTTFRIHLNKIEDTSKISVVTDKTTFEISDNSRRLFSDAEKQKKINHEDITEYTPEKNQDINIKSAEENKETKVKDIFDQFDFSTREKEIATLIIEGNSDKEIASKLNISPQTVATHNKKIFRKTGVHSRVELINKVR